MEELCNKYGINDYTINEDGFVNVDGSVDLNNCNLTEIPIKFGRINGDFKCAFNRLVNLKNSPTYVYKNFYCNGNYLTTLFEGPKVVNGEYWCSRNNLKDIQGFPESFQSDLYIVMNPICEILNIVPEKKRVRFIYWLNEHKTIRNRDTIIQSRLEEALCSLGVEELITIDFNFNNYKVI
jgi:hypothetical protein